MAAAKKKKKTGKTYRFQLSLSGILGIAVVCFCLFMWMFLLGIWAGQTILLPAAKPAVGESQRRPAASVGKGQEIEHLDSGAKIRPAPSDQTRNR